MSKPHSESHTDKLTSPSVKTMTCLPQSWSQPQTSVMYEIRYKCIRHVQEADYRGDLGTPDQIPVFVLTSIYCQIHLAGLVDTLAQPHPRVWLYY